MINRLLSVILGLLAFVSVIATAASIEFDSSSPEKVVTSFQTLPPYELFCKDETGDGTQAINVGAKFESYLSKDFYKLFMWSQCVEPEMPPFYAELNNKYFWDIRFGIENSGLTNRVNNIRIQPAKHQGQNKATVKLLFDPMPQELKNVTTIYTLIREDGHWKIDDIAPKGDYEEGSEGECLLEHSDSIKTDMRNNYRAAEERYKQEQAKKGAAPKP